ncbi:BTB domain-containing protein [Mycena kentingensis (nom. inval.)]|nr:BTB domain-containing protein [Mycena kentingensis (nom. inval.)]
MDETAPTNSTPRPLKRQRTHSSACTTRHAEFYVEGDGLCVIRVEATLFKVHRYLLVKATDVFSDLFKLPQGATTEGTSDDNPIVLSDDSAADFASLLKYLYSSGCDTNPQDIPLSELQNVFAVAKLAHKYQMKGWQKWAANVLHTLVRWNRARFSSVDFGRCYDLAYLLNDRSLQAGVIAAWGSRVIKGELPAPPALDAAEAHAERFFLCDLYKFELSRIPTTFSTTLNYTGYKPIHIQRIFVGHWSLRAWWTHYAATPYKLVALPACAGSRHENCVREFESRWRDAVVSAERKYPSIALLRLRIDWMQKLVSALPNASRVPCQYTSSNAANDPFTKTLADLGVFESHFFAAESTPSAS